MTQYTKSTIYSPVGTFIINLNNENDKNLFEKLQNAQKSLYKHDLDIITNKGLTHFPNTVLKNSVICYE